MGDLSTLEGSLLRKFSLMIKLLFYSLGLINNNKKSIFKESVVLGFIISLTIMRKVSLMRKFHSRKCYFGLIVSLMRKIKVSFMRLSCSQERCF